MKTTYNVYKCEAACLNMSASMHGIPLQDFFDNTEYKRTMYATPAQYKARVGFYVKKIIALKKAEAERKEKRLAIESARREALGEEGRAREDAYLVADRAATKIAE